MHFPYCIAQSSPSLGLLCYVMLILFPDFNCAMHNSTHHFFFILSHRLFLHSVGLHILSSNSLSFYHSAVLAQHKYVSFFPFFFF